MATSAPARFAKAVFGPVVDYALPPRCPGCGEIVAADHSFCLDCWHRLDFLGGPACGICAEPLELAGEVCGACLADPPPFARLVAGVAYGDTARSLALKLKHGGRPHVAGTVARVLARRLGALSADTLVVPVPLHRRRIWWRGYNQAALIAGALVRRTGGRLAPDLLTRRKPTPMLRGLGPAARARTVSGAFVVTASWKQAVRGMPVVLVDDVYTTGATVRACARVLRRAGAAEVVVACWARVVRGTADTPTWPELPSRR